MRNATRFVLLLIVGLGGLAAIGYFALTNTMRDWFVADIVLRSRLAVASAHRGLVSHWSPGDARSLTEVLTDIARDDRIMSAAACSYAGEPLAATDGYPTAYGCARVVSELRVHTPHAASDGLWTMAGELPGGPIHLSILDVVDRETHLGVVVLVHDMGFLSRRDATTRNGLALAFIVLSLSAAIVTIGAARLAWRGWIQDLRRALDGEPSREFGPLVGDVRELVERLSKERESEAHGGRWTPERLRDVLRKHLHGERVVIVANREPYIHEATLEGGVKVLHPASGLVTALEPVMRACSGVWVAHGSGSADRQCSDTHDRVKVPPGEESYVVRRVWLTDAEESGYYYGFSNEGMWPLCHVAHIRPTFRAEDWDTYRRVNEKFAEAVCEEVDTDDPVILVQDYHFALAPRMIRRRLPRATILTFWHIPWPNAERFGICPWKDELIEGLLGSSIVGFHTQQHCNNFLDAVDTFLEARIDREHNGVVQGGRKTLVRAYPISIEWPNHWAAGLPPAAQCRAELFAELGLAPDALLGVGVDRLDYTKGIEERLLAVDELLARHPHLRGRFAFVQIAAPSRTRIGPYQDLNDRVEALATTINTRWGTDGYRPVILRRSHHEPPAVFRYLRAADVCYVSSLHDGMNLVAKEFVAARDDERGVLVLSQFTGAARELTEALIVNPYDLRQASDALAAAVTMSVSEQRERMRAMRSLVSELNVYRWAGHMLTDAAQLRRRERLSGRLSGPMFRSEAPAP